MKCMIVLSALVAAAFAGVAPIVPLTYAAYNPALTFGYSTVAGQSYVSSPYYASPVIHAPAAISHSYLRTIAAPAVVAAPVAPAVVAAPAAPAVVAAPVAPAVVAAPVAPAVVAAPAVVPVAGVKTQYHAQDELGQASYGHSEPTQTHNAVQDAAGNKVGSFSYVAPNGQVLRTDYVADALGYRVSSNALPVGPAPVADTPEVVAARSAHLALHARAKRDLIAVGQTPASTAPLASAVVAPVAYSSPVAYSNGLVSPIAYSQAIAAPLAYSHGIATPLAYSAHGIAGPLAYSASPLVREATLTTVVNNPGHAVSYRVD